MFDASRSESDLHHSNEGLDFVFALYTSTFRYLLRQPRKRLHRRNLHEWRLDVIVMHSRRLANVVPSLPGKHKRALVSAQPTFNQALGSGPDCGIPSQLFPGLLRLPE